MTAPFLRVLHAVRTLGYADAPSVAGRAQLPADEAEEHLLDLQARGWVAWSSFGGDGGWSLTEEGRRRGEALLAEELDAAGAGSAVTAAHAAFLAWNDRVAAACTAWQLAELGIASAPADLDEILAELRSAAAFLAGMEAALVRHLDRFGGYHRRFAAALDAAAGDPRWITATDRPSCHRVWFELHEDLVATLGLRR
ncbi:hypothetical protein [Nocardioides humi]|uniref:Transcriptional regulator n=1 Tax=Nocardioides humi TaxID=449461 RepID=A0ABN2ARI7_9ACTN|nr:hypothetical protein [Nocardioides humi]